GKVVDEPHGHRGPAQPDQPIRVGRERGVARTNEPEIESDVGDEGGPVVEVGADELRGAAREVLEAGARRGREWIRRGAERLAERGRGGERQQRRAENRAQWGSPAPGRRDA